MRNTALRLVVGVAAAMVVTGGLATTAQAGAPVGTAACPVPPTRDLNVTKIVYQVGKRHAVSPKVMLAGFEAGWVESHMNNLGCGDADSLGVFQQRPSQGWGTPDQIMNVDYAATQFFTRAINVDRANPGHTAGQVAADVQRPREDLRGRYDQSEPTARQLLAEVATTTGRGDRIGDVSGDGYADLVATKADGTLHYFPNNINSNPGHPYGNYEPIGVGFGPFTKLRSGDISGDGYADLIGVQGDGSLHYLPNNVNSNPGHPYGNAENIGSGFQEFTEVVLGDVSGDGYADLLATKADGTLHYFPNNINSNRAHPFGPRFEIGTGFESFTHLRAGDVSGDGYADLIGVQGDGTLHHLPNNINSNPDHPYGDAQNIGSGFQEFTGIVTGDVSGDGYADLLATKADGTLHYFPNNINSSPTGRPYGSRSQIGTGFEVFNRIV
ncbi:VCBS repeat-containing protein [Lentzea tibetensis]|uniref:VCBS repeat-containing protein n=1 Tax=Lentzea tibetensis TaxID=2591470 RepID=A0A563EKG7_9PSEU|nr:VCBS repeat-containing protein [Lentzea tibetensis]TWP47458.1 VCBS repeat-containing protein [Lentzea tibetensis]